ncbi:MAG: glycosylase [Planctomycetaceae bacterium]
MRSRFALACLLAAAMGTGWAGTGWAAAHVPAELIRFGPPSTTPLFSGGGPDAWDRDLRERGWIMQHGGRWHLWYTGSNPDRDPLRRLGHATSADGLTWTRSSDRPVVPDRWVEDVCVATACDQCGWIFRMVAEGEHDVAHLLVSRDLARWRPCGPLDIRLAAGGPIPAGPRGTPVLRAVDGRWLLFYERRDEGVWLATSSDGRTFTNVRDEPVLACGPEAFDRHGIAIDQVVKFDGRWYAYYHSSPDPDRATWQTCLAASDDLVHWEKWGGNPLLPVDPEHPKRSSATLIHDGERLRLYTTHPDVRVRFSVDRVAAGRLSR